MERYLAVEEKFSPLIKEKLTNDQIYANLIAENKETLVTSASDSLLGPPRHPKTNTVEIPWPAPAIADPRSPPKARESFRLHVPNSGKNHGGFRV